MSGVRVPHCPPKIHCNPKIKASGWSLPPAQTQSNGLCCPAGQFLYISDLADGLHICPVFTAGGPVLREANSQQKLGGPGLDFQTWDSTNPSHARITPLKRRCVYQIRSGLMFTHMPGCQPLQRITSKKRKLYIDPTPPAESETRPCQKSATSP